MSWGPGAFAEPGAPGAAPRHHARHLAAPTWPRSTAAGAWSPTTDGRQLTYRAGGQAGRAVGPAASPPRRQPGDRVVINTANDYELFLLCLAASRAGCIPVPINPQMRADEVAHVVADAEAALVVRTVHQVDRSEPLTEAVPVGADDVAALFYTSGTTGRPKGAELTHRALVGRPPPACCGRPPCTATRPSFSLPIAHIMGFAVLVGTGLRRRARLRDAAVPAGRGARRHRAPSSHDLRRRAGDVPDAARGRSRAPRPHVGAGVGLGRRRHAGRAGPPVQEDGRDRDAADRSDPSARPPSSRATAWSRSAEAWRPRSRRR